MAEFDVAIVGAGIVGLAHAWAAARRGLRVGVFERTARAAGASVRNFGMVWPIGQPAGTQYQMALASREHWLTLKRDAGIWAEECGSLHLAHQPDELAVLEEFADQARHHGYECRLLTPNEVQKRSPGARVAGLLGGLWSGTELAVNPRTALQGISQWLTDRFKVRFHFGTPICCIGETPPRQIVQSAEGASWPVQRVIVCGGTDVPTLFPNEFAQSGLVLCKLQMMRTVSQPGGWRLATHLASGLTLRHYRAFEICPSLGALKVRIAQELPECDRYGVHVMASQNDAGEVILGDSHEYGDAIEPFDKIAIDELILREVRKVFDVPDWTIEERWHGFYAKHPTQPIVQNEPRPGVLLSMGTGGAGMTMAFGLAEDAWRWD